jgi:hypothetical protein
MIRVALDLDEDNVLIIKRPVDPERPLAAVLEALQVAQHEMETMPGVRTLTVTQTDIDPTTGQPRLAHIIAPEHDLHGRLLRTGVEIAMEARVHGQEITAICGWRLQPSRDSRRLKACGECSRRFREATGRHDGWVEA